MARPIRIEYEGAVYHVTIRGNEQKALFKTDADRERFIKALAESVECYDIRLYLYCLMTNHAHFVLETPRGNLSRFMQRFQTAYTVYYNKRHNRSGHLLQGRFGATIVDEDRYILKLSRYVHLNPVFIKSNKSKPLSERINILREYPWSSYRSYIGKASKDDFIDYEPILGMMDGSRLRLKSAYRRFVESGIINTDSAMLIAKNRSRLCIGSDDAVERIEARYNELFNDRDYRENSTFQRERYYLESSTVLAIVCEVFNIDVSVLYQRTRSNIARSLAAKCLCQWSGLSQREVGELLRIGNNSAVSKRLKQLSELLQKDKKAKDYLAEIDQKLAATTK